MDIEKYPDHVEGKKRRSCPSRNGAPVTDERLSPGQDGQSCRSGRSLRSPSSPRALSTRLIARTRKSTQSHLRPFLIQRLKWNLFPFFIILRCPPMGFNSFLVPIGYGRGMHFSRHGPDTRPQNSHAVRLQARAKSAFRAAPTLHGFSYFSDDIPPFPGEAADPCAVSSPRAHPTSGVVRATARPDDPAVFRFRGRPLEHCLR